MPHLVAAAPELYVSIGDFPYTDNGPVAETVALYRERHAALRADPRARALFEATGVRAIYDDHEFRNNWDAHFAALEPARYAHAVQVWDEFFPLRDAPPRSATAAGGGARTSSASCSTAGASAARTPRPTTRTRRCSASRSSRGSLDGLARSTATFKVVFTSIPLDFGTGDDFWGSFTTERQQIFDALLANRRAASCSCRGDQHWFAAHRHALRHPRAPDRAGRARLRHAARAAAARRDLPGGPLQRRAD